MDPKEVYKEYLSQFPCPEADSIEFEGAVLLSDEIERLVGTIRLIEPFDRGNLKPASYELTVGDEWYIDGVRHKAGQGDDTTTISIGSSQMAILQTREVINLPRFLIARWNIRVTWAYQGLLWVGAPQVDPGWVNRLPCPVYNLSQRPVCLEVGDAFARIDFVRTTRFQPGKGVTYPRSSEVILKEGIPKGASVDYPRPPASDRIFLEDYLPEERKSGLRQDLESLTKILKASQSELSQSISSRVDRVVANAEERSNTAIRTLRQDMGSLQQRVDQSVGEVRTQSFTGFSVIAVALGALVTALAVLVSSGSFAHEQGWSTITTALSIVAIALSLVSISIWLSYRRHK